MTLFSDADCMACHRVRFLLAEKGIQVDIETVDPVRIPEELTEINPTNSLPTLADRDLVLYDADVIAEYLDERYPHPPFLPIDPVSRARARLALHRIKADWYALVPALEAGGAQQEQAQQQLVESLIASSDVFDAMPFFLSEELSVLDLALAPLLWRLSHFGIELPGSASSVQQYCKRIFARSGFQTSLSGQERDLG